MAARPVLEVLDEHACRAHLRTASIGRIGTTIGALPAVLPMAYSMLDDDIVFRCRAGSRLTEAILAAPVAFEVDHLDHETRTGWSVMVVGRATPVDLARDLARIEALPLDVWSNDGHDHVLRIDTRFVTGRRVLRLAHED
jgi:nitroimidazol reductase NimA-like FMN-containing flavoprotein (pyridoxamine 5'-phosphate oxidase superfamily)